MQLRNRRYLQNKRKVLVVELKKSSATVLDQVLRCMGYVKEQLAEPNQTIHCIIIAQEGDPKARRAISIVPSIQIYPYQGQLLTP